MESGSNSISKDKIIIIVMAVLALGSVIGILVYSKLNPTETTKPAGTPTETNPNNTTPKPSDDDGKYLTMEFENRFGADYAPTYYDAPQYNESEKLSSNQILSSIVTPFDKEKGGDLIKSASDNYKAFLRDKIGNTTGNLIFKNLQIYLKGINIYSFVEKDHAKTMMDVITIALFSDLNRRIKLAGDDNEKAAARELLSNRIENLKNKSSFSNALEEISYISFEGFELNYFPHASIFTVLKKLERMDLSGLGAGIINPALEMATKYWALSNLVTNLNLSNNGLTDISISRLSKFKDLIRLDLRKNDIKNISGNFEKLKALEVILVDDPANFRKMFKEGNNQEGVPSKIKVSTGTE